MVDFTIPDEIRDISEGLNTFIEREILPIEKMNEALFANERNLYDDAGRYVPKHAELRKQVRMKSAAAGFYTMFGAKELGGAGLGLTNELGLNVIYRWARTMRIPDGTSEIQRRNIARRLLDGDIEI